MTLYPSKQFSLSLTLAAASVLSFSTPAHATLTSYTGAGNVGLVYSSVSNVTWTQDANLFKTMYEANPNLINLIAAVTPSYNDPSSFWGVQTIDADDFNTSNGRMTWWGAKAWVNYLNSVNYGGSNLWALPDVGSNPQFGYNQTTSDLGNLYFNELNAKAYPGTNGSDWGLFGNGGFGINTPGSIGPFNNANASTYWLNTEAAPSHYYAWIFITADGSQYGFGKDGQGYAWAVSPGRVNAVPVPGAVWLFGTGLVGLVGLKRRGYAG